MNKSNIALLASMITVFSILFMLSCSSDDEPTSSSIDLPSLNTSSVSSITQTTAQCGGTVSSDGGATVTARGVCWSTNPTPTISDDKTTDGDGTGGFTSSVAGLTANTEYYIRAYAINNKGTGYGSIRAFTTLTNPELPTVSTSSITAITQISAQCGGNVTSDGGAAVTVRGVCWSTSSLPTTSDSKTTDGSGTGAFSSSITGLTANTTYYVRAYAANNVGTNYGDTISFTTQTLFAPLVADFNINYVSSVYSIDLDNDGDNDLAAVSNNGGDKVFVSLNNGNATLWTTSDYYTGYNTSPWSVFSADFNGDSYNDLVTANENTDDVSVFLNNGDGTFLTANRYDAGDDPNSVFAIDLNNDDDIDLVVANRLSSNVSIIIGNGDGTFQNAVNYDVGGQPLYAISSDFNGDADNDLAICSHETYPTMGYISVLLNNGDGTFMSAVNYNVNGTSPYSICSADLDNDGDYDLATANNGTDCISIFMNNGNGSFQTAEKYDVGDGPFSIYSADLDADGYNEIAVTNSSSDNVSILFSNGDGTFKDAVNYAVGNSPFSVNLIDLDGDGDNDLVTANYSSNGISVLLNTTY